MVFQGSCFQAGWIAMNRLLGIQLHRTTSFQKEDFKTSLVKLVYGTTFVVPGKFVSSDNTQPVLLLPSLQKSFSQLLAKPMSQHCDIRIAVPECSQMSEYKLICHDSHQLPLIILYDGPFKVLHQTAMTLTLDLSGPP